MRILFGGIYFVARQSPVSQRANARVSILDQTGLAALAATSCAVLITDAAQHDGPIVYANAAFTILSGYALEEVTGRNCRFLQGPDTDRQTCDDIRAAIAAGTSIQRSILNYRKDGTPFWNDVTIDPVRDQSGRVTHHVGVQHVADLAQMTAAAQAEAESRLASIASHIPGYVYRRIMRKDGTIEVLYISPSLRQLLGVDETGAGLVFYDHVHPDDHEGLITAIRNSAANMSIFREEFRLISADGLTHWMRSDAPPRRTANGEIVWDGLAIEISAEKRWESEIANQAFRDPLTGLLTRTAWRNALDLQLNASTHYASRCGVVYIDIEGFSALNDRLGAALADALLYETAQRLARTAAAFIGIGARLGGDEFAVLIPECGSEEALLCAATRVGEALAAPIEIGGQDVVIRTFIGAALGKNRQPREVADRDAASELTKQAELALRWAKQAGPNEPIVYSRERDDRFQNQNVLAQSLEHAIANDDLELHYQPLVDLATGRIVSAEALVRWRHRTLGMQRPDLFIPLAEKLGLIGQLGQWVLVHAMRQHRQWQEAGLAPPQIAINMSGNQLLDPAFIGSVEDALRLTGASAKDFEIELTEGVLIEPSPQIMASLGALRTMGFTLTIDDFGSGHATFRYLREFPVDKLKIDQIFVRKLVLDSTDALIIRAIISLARSMGLAFVAEGIETEMQREFLEREGCVIGQGYLFSMPLLAEDFAWMLTNHVRLPLGGPPEVDQVHDLEGQTV
ncbi:putative bifunctional diguanylate cyclase/phosphodiesterase [Sphingomonas faeni]|uniref:putative bifunctional diguanylate cyclase/phosphodiesterase n=1 Tax=Sphingomonas faeni TaxID=185950 RepID=UPI0027878D01|nr:EAL domain-containing protein [Sphingomonas faeni]MDQ0840007.1 diguanylate cyclase (GGDEF)-like protein/PAS domain S-box-containing protein [Sphingomonas faeni]